MKSFIPSNNSMYSKQDTNILPFTPIVMKAKQVMRFFVQAVMIA